MKWVITSFIIFSFMLLSVGVTYADKIKSFEEKEQEVLNFNNLKSVLKDDDLLQEKEIERKRFNAQKIKEIRQTREYKRFSYPQDKDFWTFLSEYWLVKNAQTLQWDIQKPEYGIASAFKNLLEKFGFYNRTIKLLVVNTPSIFHYSLPANKDEHIFIISLPFMRTLDLSKVEISLLLLEDFFRDEAKLFRSNLKTKISFLGENFYKKKMKKKELDSLLELYSKQVFNKGFSFQQQFQVTKKMDTFLRTDLPLWNAYVKMLNKIDRLIQTNLMYKKYNKIYPSPQLQIKWLTPKKDTL